MSNFNPHDNPLETVCFACPMTKVCARRVAAKKFFDRDLIFAKKTLCLLNQVNIVCRAILNDADLKRNGVAQQFADDNCRNCFNTIYYYWNAMMKNDWRRMDCDDSVMLREYLRETLCAWDCKDLWDKRFNVARNWFEEATNGDDF